MDAGPAGGTAAGSKRRASRRTRTRAAAGTACRRPPRGLAHVSHDRIRGRLSARRANAADSSEARELGIARSKCVKVSKVVGCGRERETERSGEARDDAQGSRVERVAACT